MFSREIFAQRLLELRKDRGETQDQLAQILRVKKAQISEMENGKKTTTLEKLVLICEHYHVSSDYLLGLSDEK
ncbi:MAG: helix-turn-helix transcriptional regulator [Oscillospiraceae bacterium]|nr:helix-turn-helix transcriptional regulator [Oscillospiraceae bacterium]